MKKIVASPSLEKKHNGEGNSWGIKKCGLNLKREKVGGRHASHLVSVYVLTHITLTVHVNLSSKR